VKKVLVIGSVILIILSGFAFRFGEQEPEYIPAEKQRTGDAKKGYEYLTTGDFIRSGIPYKTYLLAAGKSKKNYLQRDAQNEAISHEYTAVKAPNGEMIVAPNCFQCHAQVFDKKLVIGLGNSEIDFNTKKISSQQLSFLETYLKTKSPSQYEAAEKFITVSKAIAPYLYTETKGVNLADHLTAVLVAHRDPQTLVWKNEPGFTIPKHVIPTDTPPWWILKKKNAMFYNGLGRGDFGRFLMGSNLLTVADTAEAAEVYTHMPDVLSFIYSLEPPDYPHKIKEDLAKDGKKIFQQTCSRCHGSYGKEESYPNLLIPASIIQTDSLLYTANYSNADFINWFNKSWFTSGNNKARLQPYKGYIAPPLDGIWITAPYLHNGSVPTLAGVLNSVLRPDVWTRNFDKPVYNYTEVGWEYFVPKNKNERKGAFDTSVPGYGNKGHYFGDHLTEQQRDAVIEYLKTL
jgi:mono/diheme cytochrome c family protein